MTTVEARDNFSELLNRSAFGKERITLTRRGKSIAVLIPIQDLELLEKLEVFEKRGELQEAVQAVQEARAEGKSPLEALEDLESFSTELD